MTFDPIADEDERIAHAVMVQPSKCIAFPDVGCWFHFKDLSIDGQCVELSVERRVIVELQCADEFAPKHEAILLSYLKTTKLRLGLILNLKTVTLKEGGIKRVVL